jgi:hypothetical protein
MIKLLLGGGGGERRQGWGCWLLSILFWPNVISRNEIELYNYWRWSNLIIEGRPVPIYPNNWLDLTLRFFILYFLFHWSNLIKVYFHFHPILALFGKQRSSKLFTIIVWHFLVENSPCLFVFLQDQFGSGYLYSKFFRGFNNRYPLLEDPSDQFRTFLHEGRLTSDDILAYFFWFEFVLNIWLYIRFRSTYELIPILSIILPISIL